MRLKSLTTGNDFLMGINDEVEYSEVKNKKERMTLALKCLAGIYINKDIASFAGFDFKSNTRQEPIEFKMATAVKKFCDILDDNKKCASKDLKDIHASFKGIVKNSFPQKRAEKALAGWKIFSNRFSDQGLLDRLREFLFPLINLDKNTIISVLKNSKADDAHLGRLPEDAKKEKKCYTNLALKCLADIYIYKELGHLTECDFKNEAHKTKNLGETAQETSESNQAMSFFYEPLEDAQSSEAEDLCRQLFPATEEMALANGNISWLF